MMMKRKLVDRNPPSLAASSTTRAKIEPTFFSFSLIQARRAAVSENEGRIRRLVKGIRMDPLKSSVSPVTHQQWQDLVRRHGDHGIVVSCR